MGIINLLIDFTLTFMRFGKKIIMYKRAEIFGMDMKSKFKILSS